MVNSFLFFAGFIVEDYYFDVRLQSAWISAGIGVGLTAVGVVGMWMGWWRPAVTGISKKVHLPWKTVVVRFLLVYILGMAAVNLW